MKDAIARMPRGLPNTAIRRASGTMHPAYRWRRSQRTGVVACGAFYFWWRDGAGFGPRCVWVFRSGSMIIRGLRRSGRRSPANHVGCRNADVRADRRPGGGGTFVFGVGMQLSGGYGSGALSTVGGGRVRMLVTPLAFCAGYLWTSLHMQWWSSLPRMPGVAFCAELGWSTVALLQISILALLWWMTRRRSKVPPLTNVMWAWRQFCRANVPCYGEPWRCCCGIVDLDLVGAPLEY